MLNEPYCTFGPFDSLAGFNGRSDFSLSDGIVTTGFSGREGSYVINFDVPEPARASVVGVHGCICLSGWKNIQYIAIGYSKPLGFKHIKIKNTRQDAWVSVGFSHQDIIWLLQNGTEKSDATEIKNIRLFIKGEPADSGATLQVRQLKLQLQAHDNRLQPSDAESGPLLDVLYKHLNHALRNYEANAKAYMQTGDYPVPGNQMLVWPKDWAQPEGLEQVSTYRAIWHAQHLPINLLQYARQTGQSGPVFAAKTLIENWLDQSFYKTDVDVKYAWYDHGTAERQLAFILMWFSAIDLQMEQRFLERLGDAIVQHARLLDSEAFYAYHQPLRYHNHAWFQDAALIASALAFPGHALSQAWLDNGVSRFEDQLDKLIIRDSGFAIFVENSIGYHHGVQRIAEFIGQLTSLIDCETEIPIVANELVAWSDFLRYPDGRAPSQGDTFRLPPRTGGDIRSGKPWDTPSFTILPKAGYAVVKGNHDGKPWMLCMFATSLSNTHKHEDNLSITFWFDGVEWLIDPSFYSHEYQQPIAAYLRSAQAHNNLYLRGTNYSTGQKLVEIAGSCKSDEFSIVGSHQAYSSSTISRTISGRLDRLELSVVDELTNKSLASPLSDVRLAFHFGEGVAVDVLPDGYQLSHPSRDTSLLLKIIPYQSQLLQGSDSAGIPLSIVGHGFQQQMPTVSLEAAPPDGEASFTWSLSVMDCSNEKLKKT
ncbi:heparinase II/III domain-containing protein [Ectopseudomonas oleovorans]|uniref:Uncharacterized protein n=1 Tax=Ectopseudomonas oleovorans (strain CECT 5344) TaxID=1182590 RepID=W6QV03_ECTO5|nr:heparinase II/III family protein [Pseudomonas oleovorans]CDM40277.1 hypothetical protein BN5_1691 [Pseudomonas oleovorans CECT 5344]CDR90907.1 hypothetical protein PPSAL_1680 [Pseudomonas oleovorans]